MSWEDRAACREHPLSWWFPDEAESPRQRQMAYRKARNICHGCPVRSECLNEALEHDIRWGMWGGYTPRERAEMRQQRPRREIARYPAAPVLDRWPTLHAAADALDIHRQQLWRWSVNGMRWFTAERLAAAVGEHPRDIWPDWRPCD